MSTFIVGLALAASMGLSAACITEVMFGAGPYAPSFVVLVTLWFAVSVAGVVAEATRKK